VIRGQSSQTTVATRVVSPCRWSVRTAWFCAAARMVLCRGGGRSQRRRTNLSNCPGTVDLRWCSRPGGSASPV